MKVYVVYWKEYDDLFIDRAFASREKAEAYIASRPDEDSTFYYDRTGYRIEEMEVE